MANGIPELDAIYRVGIWRGFERGFLGASHVQVPADGEGAVTSRISVD